VSFEVRDQEDLWQLKQRLEDADQWVSEVIDHGFIYSIYTFDPNHIPIEFSWPVAGVDLRENPCMADTAPSILATEGSEPQPGRWPVRVRDSSGEKRAVYPGEGTVLLDEDACLPAAKPQMS
jgi:hypothetical protein